ncbi:MAG TPA: sigma-54 dependent transcriptional regulator [bacterium]
MSEKRILIIDDDPSVIATCERVLKAEGYMVMSGTSGETGLLILKNEDVDVVLSDLRLPDTNGIDLLKFIKAGNPDIEVIVMTAYGTIESAVSAVKLGAYDYITKPFETIEILSLTVKKAIERRMLIKKTKELEQNLEQKFNFGSLIGKSPKMLGLFKLGEVISQSDSSILVQGESGTGKELFAKAIHYHSKRRQDSFVAINCAALTETLIESELFGHERGAFTGAIQKKEGLFEMANGGTAFLDEIGEVPPSIQVKLLRVLQEGEMRRVGSNEMIKVNVRIIAATNRDLKQAIKEGVFREDLYYRLNVISVTIPPLRERTEDIPLLAQHFLKIYSDKAGRKVSRFSPQALRLILSYSWPGNVREFENAIERSVILCQDEVIKPEHLLIEKTETGSSEGLPQDTLLPYKEAKNRAFDNFHKKYIKALLIKFDGDVSTAAKEIGMDPSNFRKLLRKTGLDPAEFRKEQV